MRIQGKFVYRVKKSYPMINCLEKVLMMDNQSIIFELIRNSIIFAQDKGTYGCIENFKILIELLSNACKFLSHHFVDNIRDESRINSGIQYLYHISNIINRFLILYQFSYLLIMSHLTQ